MNKHIISKFKDYCRKELNLQEVDIEGFLDIYNDRTRKLDGFLNQEKYALLMTYYNFFDEEGNLNYDSIDEHLNAIAIDKEGVFKTLFKSGEADEFEGVFDSTIVEYALCCGETPFQWGLDYESDIIEIADDINELCDDFFAPEIVLKIKNFLLENDKNFKYLYYHERFDKCLDFVKEKTGINDVQANKLVNFISSYEQYVIEFIRKTFDKKEDKSGNHDNADYDKTPDYPIDKKTKYDEPGQYKGPTPIYREDYAKEPDKPKQKPEPEKRKIVDKKTFDKIIDKHFKMIIGLDEIKNEIKKIVAKSYYSPQETSYNLLITGNPGTGKSTAAKIIGNVLYDCGILTANRFVHLTAAGLQAEYVGQTIPKIQKAFKAVDGGVLFLDEIYSLATDTAFCQEAVNELLKQLESPANKNTVVIAAGYDDKIQSFFNMNPGLKSRFSKTIKLNNYSIENLTKIAKIAFLQEHSKATDEALELLTEHFKTKINDKNFGNARYVKKAVKDITQNASLRAWENQSTELLAEKSDVETFIKNEKENETIKPPLGFAR